MPGTYIVDASKDGYSDDLAFIRTFLDRLTHDQQTALLSAFPQVIVRSSGAAREDVVLRRAGEITGRVTVDVGGTIDPGYVTATLVSSSFLGSLEGREDQKPTGFSQRGVIDDRGSYRIAGLPAGKYRLSVRITEAYFEPNGSGANVTMQPQRTGTAVLTIFAPATFIEKDAKSVEVRDGEEVSDADVSIPREILHSIGGVVTQGATPIAGAVINVQSQGQKVMEYDAISTSSGSYRFDLLPSGIYSVEVRYPNPVLSRGHSATRKITVRLGDTDLVDANVDVPIQGHAQ
jgi:hypothetical protein